MRMDTAVLFLLSFLFPPIHPSAFCSPGHDTFRSTITFSGSWLIWAGTGFWQQVDVGSHGLAFWPQGCQWHTVGLRHAAESRRAAAAGPVAGGHLLVRKPADIGRRRCRWSV